MNSLYKYKLYPDTSLPLDQYTIESEDSLLIVKEEVEAALRSLKHGKLPGMDKLSSELVKNGDDETVKALTAV